jgi:hypothetical protein
VSTGGSTAAQSGGAGCSWWGFGKTDTSNVTATVAAGLPIAPTNVGASAPYNTATGYISKNSSGSCGALSYDNLAGGGIARLPLLDPIGYEMGAPPYVQIPDVSGSGASISGSGYVTSNPLPTSPQQTKAGAAASMAASLVLFANNPEATYNAPIGSKGLVAAILDQSSVDCVSGTSSVNGTIVGKYTFRLFWWGKGTADASARWHTARWTYDSSINAVAVLTAGSDVWDPANTLLGNGRRLSELVQGSGTAPNIVATGASNGLRGFPTGVFTLTTAPTLFNETSPGFSAINVQLGQLSCVADDQR